MTSRDVVFVCCFDLRSSSRCWPSTGVPSTSRGGWRRCLKVTSCVQPPRNTDDSSCCICPDVPSPRLACKSMPSLTGISPTHLYGVRHYPPFRYHSQRVPDDRACRCEFRRYKYRVCYSQRGGHVHHQRAKVVEQRGNGPAVQGALLEF